MPRAKDERKGERLGALTARLATHALSFACFGVIFAYMLGVQGAWLLGGGGAGLLVSLA